MRQLYLIIYMLSTFLGITLPLLFLYGNETPNGLGAGVLLFGIVLLNSAILIMLRPARSKFIHAILISGAFIVIVLNILLSLSVEYSLHYEQKTLLDSSLLFVDTVILLVTLLFIYRGQIANENK